MDKNRRLSSLKRTNYFKAKYFLIKDKIQEGGIEFEHCSTEKGGQISQRKNHGKALLILKDKLVNVTKDYDDTVE